MASSRDGVQFATVAVLDQESFGAESLERPALSRAADGLWRLLVSCATPGTAHRRVDVLSAPTPGELASATPRTVLPGSSQRAVKDPVVIRQGDVWHLWASVHPLDDPAHTDRMWTEHATSPDGDHWAWDGVAPAGRPGAWDARGARMTSVMLDEDVPLATYDGRRNAEENREERTGIAVGTPRWGGFAALGDGPAASSPLGGGGLRYLSLVRTPAGELRSYWEATRADGTHDLRTTVLAPDRIFRGRQTEHARAGGVV